VHLSLFAALALAGRWAGVRPRPLGALLAGYALLSELVQALTPLQRSGSVADWLADVLGVALAFLAWEGVSRARSSR
jgi:VanZ family protein